jgi:hypothetical protein
VEEVTKCPYCDNTSFKSEGYVENKAGICSLGGAEVEAWVRSNYYSCRVCGLVFKSPRLTDSELELFYSSGEYRRMMGDQTQEQLDTDEISRADRIASLTNHPLRHLDVGSSRGYLLNKVGASVQIGVELNKNYAEKEYGGEVSGKFDLITIIHVLEHVNHPVEFLARYTELLTDDGKMIIEVPSDMSAGGPLRFAHTFYFAMATLSRIILKAGLQPTQSMFTPHTLFICERK